MKALSETENIDLFNNVSIRAMIENKWPLVKKGMIKKLFTPYIIFLTLFFVYSTWIFEYLQDIEQAKDKDGDGVIDPDVLAKEKEIGWDF